jgi:hypothetical protein
MAHAQASAGKGCIMKVIRTRILIALASLTVMASAFGLTALAASSGSPGTAMLTASQFVTQASPNGTIIDY